ncbi:hypothetical protein BDV93DRAFT_564179 [Ceratobasidium sp. AG-I]|nr:hypothetical protein BDV93DRAFT_564179 [Ceratobasidium sp. AG-I]
MVEIYRRLTYEGIKWILGPMPVNQFLDKFLPLPKGVTLPPLPPPGDAFLQISADPTTKSELCVPLVSDYLRSENRPSDTSDIAETVARNSQKTAPNWNELKIYRPLGMNQVHPATTSESALVDMTAQALQPAVFGAPAAVINEDAQEGLGDMGEQQNQVAGTQRANWTSFVYDYCYVLNTYFKLHALLRAYKYGIEAMLGEPG